MVEHTRRRNFIKAVGAGSAVALAGCLGDDGGDDAIKLGMLMGVTEGLEELGPPIRDAAQLVPDQFADADTDIEIDVQFEDTETNASVGVNGAEALDDAGYQMIVGALSSSVSISVAEDVAIPRGIPMISPASTAPGYSDLEGDFTFRTAVPDGFQGELLAQLAAEELGAESAATIAQDDDYGEGLSNAFADAFESEQGGEITEQVIFAEGETSYTSQLQSALEDDPDTMLVVTYPEDGARIFDDFYSNFDRDDMEILVSDGLQDSDLPDSVGYDMTNVSGTAPIGSGPGVDFFEQQYEDAYDEDPTGQPFVRQAYDAAATLVLAAAAAGENDGEAIRDEIRPVTASGGEEILPADLVEGAELAQDGEEIQYRGVSGEIEYNENGDQDSIAYEYFRFTEDGLETIETIEF